jgi:hypothetical protein
MNANGKLVTFYGFDKPNHNKRIDQHFVNTDKTTTFQLNNRILNHDLHPDFDSLFCCYFSPIQQGTEIRPVLR